MALAEELSQIADNLYVVQECKTLFPGQVDDLYRKSEIMAAYFDRVDKAESKVFGYPRFLAAEIRQFIMQRGDINHLELSLLGPALESDYFIVFSGSHLKGALLDFLVEKRAVNIHAGISPYYRGISCNFWACDQKRPDLVGSTIHLLSKKLDSGPILFHALPKAEPSDPFTLGMEAVRAAHLGLAHHIRKESLYSIEPVAQDKSLEIKYSKIVDFTDNVACEYLSNIATPEEIGRQLSKRDTNLFIRPFVPT